MTGRNQGVCFPRSSIRWLKDKSVYGPDSQGYPTSAPRHAKRNESEIRGLVLGSRKTNAFMDPREHAGHVGDGCRVRKVLNIGMLNTPKSVRERTRGLRC